MRPEYEFQDGARGKYASELRERSVVVVLDPDVAEWFHDSTAVNEALRALAEIARRQAEKRTG